MGTPEEAIQIVEEPLPSMGPPEQEQESVPLLPCPFCGPGQSQVGAWWDDVSNRYRVGCGRCGCSTGIHPRDKTMTSAILAWNTRNS